MSHSFDSKSNITKTASSSIISAYTCGNTATLLVLTICTNPGARTGGAPTYNGVEMTLATTQASPSRTHNELWYMLAPPVGAAYNVVIPNTGAVNVTAEVSSYSSSTGFSAFRKYGTAIGTIDNPTLAISAIVASDLCVACVGSDSSNWDGTPPSPGVSLYGTDNGDYGDAAQYKVATATAISISWVVSDEAGWGIVGAAFYSSTPSPSVSESPSISPSISPSVSPSISPSTSPSESPSTSLSPSTSPSISASISPSGSPSESVSPSASLSPSSSPSESPSASISPSVSPSVSPSASISPSVSPSTSPSASVSPSLSPSPSPGWVDYTRGEYAALPANAADLSTTYTVQDLTDISVDDGVRVGQSATFPNYAIHQFKNYIIGRLGKRFKWNGQSNLAPSSSIVRLQIYNVEGAYWETIAFNDTAAANTDFDLQATLGNIDSYFTSWPFTGDSTVTLRVYQQGTSNLQTDYWISGASSASPSASPSRSPSVSPSVSPSRSPSVSPSASPSVSPSVAADHSPKLAVFYKNPSDRLDYTVEWATVIGGASIVSSYWNIPTPLVGSSATIGTNFTTTYIAGGTLGKSYKITNIIVTSTAEVLSQSFIIICHAIPTTSGVSIFNVTRDEIITLAFEDLGTHAPGFEVPTAGEMKTASKRLNMMVKAWQAAGVGLWLNTIQTLALTTGTQSYLIGPSGTPATPRPLNIVEARRVTTSGDETPLYPMSRDEYMSLPIKSTTGIPTSYYYDPQTINGIFYVWPVATDLTDVIKMTVRTPIQDFVNIDDNADFPTEWLDALHFNLAVRMAPMFRIPPQEYMLLKELATTALADADGFDREQNTSVFITPASGPGR